MDILFLNEHRCQNCNKLLFKGIFIDSIVEIKCSRCGTINKKDSRKLNYHFNQYLLKTNGLGDIISISGSASDMLGYTEKELIGKNFLLIFPRIQDLMITKFIEKESNLDTYSYLKFDTHQKQKDGVEVPVKILLKSYLSVTGHKCLNILVLLNNEGVDKIFDELTGASTLL
jgi:PAS domain S-box-containing protein